MAGVALRRGEINPDSKASPFFVCGISMLGLALGFGGLAVWRFGRRPFLSFAVCF